MDRGPASFKHKIVRKVSEETGDALVNLDKGGVNGRRGHASCRGDPRCL